MLGLLPTLLYAVHCLVGWITEVPQQMVNGTSEASALYGTAALAKRFGPPAPAVVGSRLKHMVRLQLTGHIEAGKVALMEVPVTWWQYPYLVSMAVLSSILAPASSWLSGGNV